MTFKMAPLFSLIFLALFTLVPSPALWAQEEDLEPSPEQLREECRRRVEASFDAGTVNEFVTLKAQSFRPRGGGNFLICMTDIKSGMPMDRVLLILRNDHTEFFWKGFAPEGFKSLAADGHKFELNMQNTEKIPFPSEIFKGKTSLVEYCPSIDNFTRYCPPRNFADAITKTFHDSSDLKYVDFAVDKGFIAALISAENVPYLVVLGPKGGLKKTQLLNAGTDMRVYRMQLHSNQQTTRSHILEILDTNKDQSQGNILAHWDMPNGQIYKLFDSEVFAFNVSWSQPQTLECRFSLSRDYDGPGAYLDFPDKKILCKGNAKELNYGTPSEVVVSFRVETGHEPRATVCKIGPTIKKETAN